MEKIRLIKLKLDYKEYCKWKSRNTSYLLKKFGYKTFYPELKPILTQEDIGIILRDDNDEFGFYDIDLNSVELQKTLNLFADDIEDFDEWCITEYLSRD